MDCVLAHVRMAMESCWNVLTRKSPGDVVFKMAQVTVANRLAGGQEETLHTQESRGHSMRQVMTLIRVVMARTEAR